MGLGLVAGGCVTLSELEPGSPRPPPPGSQEPSPYEESEVHDSFHQLIQEQSQRAAQEELELQRRQWVAGTLGVPGETRPGGWQEWTGAGDVPPGHRVGRVAGQGHRFLL